jgi:hypothetical protein
MDCLISPGKQAAKPQVYIIAITKPTVRLILPNRAGLR